VGFNDWMDEYLFDKELVLWKAICNQKYIMNLSHSFFFSN
jgi:hypothetical protein